MEEDRDIEAVDHLRSNFFLPHWWVWAFTECPDSFDAFQKSMAEPLVRPSLLPLFNQRELGFWGVFLSRVQVSLLNRSTSAWDFPIESLVKESGAQGKSATESFFNFLGRLGGARLLSESSSSFDSMPLFSSETWVKSKDGLQLRLIPNEYSEEAILGYRCGYRRVAREFNSQPSLAGIKIDRKPIVTSKSLWLELSLFEQGVQLQMEVESQWQKKWIHPDGVATALLPKAVDALVKRQHKVVNRTLSKGIDSLRRFGKKLTAHGRVSQLNVHEFYAFEPFQGASEILWQSDRSYPADEYESEYSALVGDYFSESALKNRASLLAFFGVRSDDDKLSSVQQQFDSLFEMHKSLKISERSIELESNLLIPSFALYWEFYSRGRPGHSLPLPESVILSPAMEVVRTGGELSSFRELVLKDPILKNALENEPLCSLMTSVTLKDPRFKNWFSKIRGKPLSRKLESSSLEDNASLKPKKHRAASPAIKKPIEENSGEHRIVTKPSMAMRSVASAELEKIQKADDGNYEDLIDSFLESLDPSSRKMFVEMKGSVSRSHYHRLLQPRLVSFMMEKPSLWKAH